MNSDMWTRLHSITPPNQWSVNQMSNSIPHDYGVDSTPIAPISIPNINSFSNRAQRQQVQRVLYPVTMTPSPSNTDSIMSYDHYLQQKHYQQQFQLAQQEASQNPNHLPIDFDPVTPPGLQPFMNGNSFAHYSAAQQLNYSSTTETERLPEALTPNNTPPRELTPPNSSQRSVKNVRRAQVTQKGRRRAAVRAKPKRKSKADAYAGTESVDEDGDITDSEIEIIEPSVALAVFAAAAEGQQQGEKKLLYDITKYQKRVYNSHGKLKTRRCKHCGLIFETKYDYWQHVHIHMKPEKIMQCPFCIFYTDLKHHDEYHRNKHLNKYPFGCDKCTYRCVSKSMLISHLKSHSSVYQYNCENCPYATKYCHSFKLHLRKYNHRPGLILDAQGNPNPLIVIDVYGTRRGPKAKTTSAKQTRTKKASPRRKSVSSTTSASTSRSVPATRKSQSPLVLQQNLPQQQEEQQQQQEEQQQQQEEQQEEQQQQQVAPQPMCLSPNPLTLAGMSYLQPIERVQQNNVPPSSLATLAAFMSFIQQYSKIPPQISLQTAVQQMLEKSKAIGGTYETILDTPVSIKNEYTEDLSLSDSAMDLSQGSSFNEEDDSDTPLNLSMRKDNATPSLNLRRGGGLLSLLDGLKQDKSSKYYSAPHASCSDNCEPQNAKVPRMESSSSSSGQTSNNSANASISSLPSSSSPHTPPPISPAVAPNFEFPSNIIFECKHCQIIFNNPVIYTMHMGYHTRDDIFKCNLCGEQCHNSIGLFVHITRVAHH